MSDVWRIPIVSPWEMKCGRHPTQKPLRLLYRIVLASTKVGDTVLDPFSGSCSTGICCQLLGRKFVGIDQCKDYLAIGVKRFQEIADKTAAALLLRKMSENNEEQMVIVNHARKELRELMIQQGICYLRAGDSQGSVLVKPGFERLHYVFLHTAGQDGSLYRLKNKGSFQIWTKETLEKYGFKPEHAPYYIVLLFERTHPVKIKHQPNLIEGKNTYKAKILPYSDFVGLK